MGPAISLPPSPPSVSFPLIYLTGQTGIIFSQLIYGHLLLALFVVGGGPHAHADAKYFCRQRYDKRNRFAAFSFRIQER